MTINLTCGGCGYKWQYKGKKRPIERPEKPARSVRTNCPRCGNNVYIREEDVKNEA